jgi:hypothetical protein
MPVSDVARAFESLLRGENQEATIETSCAPDIADATLAIDTTRLSTGMRLVARLLGGGKDTTLQATYCRADGDVLRVVVSVSGGAADAAARRAQRVVEWAVAARMLELHGGDLVTEEERPGSARCVLTLPLAS